MREADGRIQEIEDQIRKVSEDKKQINYEVSIHKNNIVFRLKMKYANHDVDIFLDRDYLLTARTGKKGIIKITKNNKIGKLIMNAINRGEALGLFV